MSYKPTIGLEIHAELKTNSKMFCSCKNNPDEKRANFNICPICMGHPGTLPVINKEAVRKVIKTGIALNCKINEVSKFDRKNYFYPDLPKGYQISQYDKPLCLGGYLKIGDRKIRITRIHLEEDTGRLLHEDDSSLVDFNRAGVPLMELVTEPDIETGKEARQFGQELQLVLRYLGVSDADMEKGQMRVEVNISLGKEKKLGTKVEIKNLNSFRIVEKAVDYEIKRQTEVLKEGNKVIQETRGWHDKKEKTLSQRKKEEAHDYRYFPEPDLPTLDFDKDFLNKLKTEIPELPSQKRERLITEYNLDQKAAEIFVFNKDLSEYFEKVCSELEIWIEEADKVKGDITDLERKLISKTAANYIISDVLGLMGGKPFIEAEFKITPENFAEFIKMLYKKEISSKIAKQILPEMGKTGADPSHILEEKGWNQITDSGELDKIVKEIIEGNKKVIDDYKSGKENALQFLVGRVMAKTRGTANPEKVQELLKKNI